jgi:hypothetical protein
MTDDVVPKRGKRPVLIWFTQAVTLALAMASLLGALIEVTRLLNSFDEAALAETIAIMISQLLAAVVSLLLCVGLIKPHPWSRWGAIVFSAALLVAAIAYQQYPGQDTSLTTRARGNFGDGLINLLLIIYPFRLYFSKKVRAFFGMYDSARFHERL